MSGLTEYSKTYKPFKYQWAMQFTEEHEKIHWGSWEAKLQEDVKQWKSKEITSEEKDHITNILRIFTQSDVAVGGNYCDIFIKEFKNNEIRNMLLSFANREGTHQRSYALLNDTLGMHESEYSTFLQFKEMSDKIDFMMQPPSTLKNKKQRLAFELARSVCNEGMSLFSAFVMLLNYQRFGKMKGMCEIVEWSIRDETCFTPETELLTEAGWMSFQDLSKDIKVAQYDESNGTISFTSPTAYIDKQYDGELTSFTSQYKFDLTATSDHDLIYLHTYKDGLVPKKVKFSEFTPHYRKKIIVSGRKLGELNELSLIDKFKIALQADGTIDYRINGKFSGCNASMFSFKKKRKIERLTNILDGLGWDYTKTSNPNGYTSFRVKSPLSVTLSKVFDWVDFDSVSAEWCSAFLFELGHWDGHFVNGSDERITYVSSDKYNVDVVQVISVLAGWSCTLGIRPDDRKSTYKDCYVANLHVDKTFKATGNVEKTTFNYKGRVMCVSVPTGNIIVRQNDRVAIVGNCHVEGMVQLFHTYCNENPEVVNDTLKSYIYKNYKLAVSLEDSLIDLMYSSEKLLDLSPVDIKAYVRYLADRRLLQLGLKPIFKQKTNPLPWLDWIVSGDSFKNFFEGTVTDYNASGMIGDFDADLYSQISF
jgi:ribonucleotide reductase beta subunit family protein with ferritin-like domain